MKKEIEPYLLDDRVIIPEDIQKMSKEELKTEIAKLEEKERTLEKKQPLSTASA